MIILPSALPCQAGADVKWIGGADWKNAVNKYNGGGDANYSDIFDQVLKALKNSETVSYRKNEDAKAAKAKADSLKSAKEKEKSKKGTAKTK